MKLRLQAIFNHFRVASLVLIPVLTMLLLPSAGVTQSGDQTAEAKGLAIAMENDKRDLGWFTYEATVEMILRNRHGQSNSRILKYHTMESLENGVKADGDKSLLIFESPFDIRDTAFLAHAHKDRDDDQWLYLPSLKRVKRISSRNKSGSFVGSEFAYEDISAEEIEKYTYKWLRDEPLDGLDCFVVQRNPVDKKNTGYTKHIVWFDKADYQIRKIDYYDRKNMLLKTLTYEGYTQYLDQYWRSAKMYMVNHQNGKSTTLIWSERNFQTGLKERDFTKNALKRSR